MVRLYATVAVVLCLAAPARADEPPVETLDNTASFVSEDTMFEALVSQGDLDRAAGRKIAAALSYTKALELKKDPLVAGRLGVLLAQLGRVEAAAENLLDGLQRARKVSKAERYAWETAYATVLAQGSWIRVTVSHTGARLVLDATRRVGGPTAFFVFVRFGEHAIHGSLSGFKDADVAFSATKDEDEVVNVVFEPLPEPSPLLPEVELPEPFRTVPARIVVDPRYTQQENPYAYPEPGQTQPEKKSGVRGSLGAGPVVVFGVATWAPAVGLSVAVSLQPHENVSIGLEGRAAWLTSGIADRPINAMTAGGILSACGHWRWLFGCALAHLGVINVDFSAQSYKPASFVNFKPGLGGRIGAKFDLTRSFAVRAAVDAVGLTSGTRIVAGDTILVDQAPVMVGVGVSGGWEF